MSHFTMIVFGSDIDEQLAPYNEQSENPEHKEFVSTEAENMSDYLTKTLKVITLPDGSKTTEYDDKYRVFDSKTFSSSYVYPEGHTVEEKKFCEHFKTFEQYMKAWCSAEERDGENGEYGYWTNPNGKWDWYQVGGRWSGFFKLKPGCFGEVGAPGAFDNKPRTGWADSVRIKDIDFEYMREDAIKEANVQYDALEAVLKGRSLVSWKAVLKDCNDDADAARIVYNSNQVIKDLKTANIDVWGDYVEVFKNSRDEYVKSCVDGVGVTFGFVLEGKWFEKGQMGWFGISHNEQEQSTWNEAYWKMVESLDPETLMTVVDCHV